MTAEASEERLLTVDDVADRWRVSAKTVQRLVNQGKLASVRIGRQIRLRLVDVMTYEDKQ